MGSGCLCFPSGVASNGPPLSNDHRLPALGWSLGNQDSLRFPTQYRGAGGLRSPFSPCPPRSPSSPSPVVLSPHHHLSAHAPSSSQCPCCAAHCVWGFCSSPGGSGLGELGAAQSLKGTHRPSPLLPPPLPFPPPSSSPSSPPSLSSSRPPQALRPCNLY